MQEVIQAHSPIVKKTIFTTTSTLLVEDPIFHHPFMAYSFQSGK